MILFTSDLDRTLIYSSRMIEAYPVLGRIRIVEKKEGKTISYMSEEAIQLLQSFHQEHLFVPVTTRALHQYKRIQFFQEELQPKYAITSNGGTILINGKVDEDWRKLLHDRISHSSIVEKEVLKLFAELRHSNWVESEHYVDQSFFMFRINRELMPTDEMDEFSTILNKNGWKLYLHGTKLYMLPIHLTKENAITQLKEYVDFDFQVAGGDSVMDYDMLCGSTISYSFKHGDLFKEKGHDNHIQWIEQLGIHAAEELLTNLLNFTTDKTKAPNL